MQDTNSSGHDLENFPEDSDASRKSTIDKSLENQSIDLKFNVIKKAVYAEGGEKKKMSVVDIEADNDEERKVNNNRNG